MRSRWLDIGLVIFEFLLTKMNKNAKKRTKPIFSHQDRTRLFNKGFIIWAKLQPFSCWTNAEKPEGAKWIHLAVCRISRFFLRGHDFPEVFESVSFFEDLLASASDSTRGKKIKKNKFTPRRKYCCHNLPAK